MLKFIKISGNSLSPEYREGDFVLIGKMPSSLYSVSQGDLFVFRHPLFGVMVKKVDRVSADGSKIYVIGTHKNSIDSRQFGPVTKDELIGKVIWHIRRPCR